MAVPAPAVLSCHAKQLGGGDGDLPAAFAAGQAGGTGKLEASNGKITEEKPYRFVFPL